MSSCIFCDIVSQKSDTKLIYEDDVFVAFKDIRPASSCHFLLVPKKHIENTRALTTADKEMVIDMKRIMLELLAESGQKVTQEISLGFHVPPFNSVKHLHLHGIAPTNEMKLIARLVFREGSWWFKEVDTIINSLPAASL